MTLSSRSRISEIAASTTTEELGEWINVIKSAVNSGYRYGEWFTRFFRDVCIQYEIQKDTGFDIHPLSPQQIFYLWMMYDELAKQTIAHVKHADYLEDLKDDLRK